jgi:hypothetical protein
MTRVLLAVDPSSSVLANSVWQPAQLYYWRLARRPCVGYAFGKEVLQPDGRNLLPARGTEE